jgi:hypothetical protein
MPFGKIRVPLEKRQAAYQAIRKAREHVAGVYADMNHEIQNNHNNKVIIAADFVKEAVKAGATAVQMDAPEVIRVAQEKTLEMERLINEAIGQGEDEMKALLHEATTAALLAEQKWKEAKEMSEGQMGGRRRSTRSNRNRNRTHRKRSKSNRKRSHRK